TSPEIHCVESAAEGAVEGRLNQTGPAGVARRCQPGMDRGAVWGESLRPDPHQAGGVSEAVPAGASSRWHLITGEFPPAPGGVSDYTAAVALGLAAAGDAGDVWCPAPGASPRPGVTVHPGSEEPTS